MPRSRILAKAAKKQAPITAWMRTAISRQEAEERGLVQISNLINLRNWACREALYDFAQLATQSQPVLALVKPRRWALFGMPATRRLQADPNHPIRVAENAPPHSIHP